MDLHFYQSCLSVIMGLGPMPLSLSVFPAFQIMKRKQEGKKRVKELEQPARHITSDCKGQKYRHGGEIWHRSGTSISTFFSFVSEAKDGDINTCLSDSQGCCKDGSAVR